MSGLPEFKSSLSYCIVRDFAYPEFHPMHYGAISSPLGDDEKEQDQEPEQPPQEQEEDLAADSIHRRAVALFDFSPENDNETALREGQVIWVSYRHGQGWLVGENLETGETGLIPEEYVQLLPEEEMDQTQPGDDEWEDLPASHSTSNSAANSASNLAPSASDLPNAANSEPSAPDSAAWEDAREGPSDAVSEAVSGAVPETVSETASKTVPGVPASTRGSSDVPSTGQDASGELNLKHLSLN